MKKLIFVALFCLAALAGAEESYLGLYLQGSKLGYGSFSTGNEKVNGQTLKRSDSRTVMNAALLGTEMTIRIDSVSWFDATGKPVRMIYSTTSAGRTQKVEAKFKGQRVSVSIDNSGTKSQRSLTIPNGGSVVDDPIAGIMEGHAKPGARRVVYVLDPTTVSFVKNEVVLKGPATVSIRGKKSTATLVEVLDPRALTKVFVGSKGDVVKVEAPMGIEMYPESRQQALSGADAGYQPSLDLAISTSLKSDKPIDKPASLTGLTVRLTGRDLSKAPSDEHQTVTGSGVAWTIDVHPPMLAGAESATIADAAAQKPEWVKPSLNIPANSEQFRTLAKTIVGDRTTVKDAALAIKLYVFKNMKPNPGIGVVRDATEVLKTKEGVCRDYAILTATLTRAANIPARLASGLVNWDGSFYYHAWVEVWDGKRWIGIDSTTDQEQISAAHIKLAQGNVEDAYMFMLLEKVKVELLDARRG
jgi:hypothetical protein